MNIGYALTFLKKGKLLTRTAWKNSHIYLENMFVFPQNVPKEFNPEIKRTYEACIIQTTNKGTHQPGWVPTVEDLLAEDWYIIGEESPKLINLPEEEYNKLVKRSDWLMCLEHAGVDNWEGYDIASDIRAEYEEEKYK